MPRNNKITDRMLEVFAPAYTPLYVPIIIGIGLFFIGVILASITNNLGLARAVVGISSIIFAVSGLFQIKMKTVPGFPTLRGGYAMVFGVFFFLLFMVLGVVIIFGNQG